MRIAAVIQARLSSTRLPKKVIKKLPYDSSVTVLGQVIRRIKRCRNVNDVIVATTTDGEDGELVKIAQREGVASFRGSRDDVLSRYYYAAKEHHLDVIVRITSDCPCIDPMVVDDVIDRHLDTQADFTTNVLPRTFPHGLDTEVLGFYALEKTYLEAKRTFEREHVCPYIYKSNPDKFKISRIEAPGEFYAPNIRITLDAEHDYALLCTVFDQLYERDKFFGVEEIIKLFCKKPWLKIINKNVIPKKIFNSLQEELEEAMRILELQELGRAKRILVNCLS